jgi:tRNA 5-methylaminomethyl-2-thiouridine biosynthesis bifunctional protein
MPIRPATVAFDASGTPYSREFGDVYHSAASGPGQARHVFLHGNDLPERWARAPVFTIVETGFGLGLNFLATWEAWRADPQRCVRLHFVSVERHPFAGPDLAVLHARYPEFAGLSAALRVAWPLAVPGLHRLHFEVGQVTLTLAFADVVDALRDLRLAADAIYLDGFAPERNPEMWSATTMKALSRLASPGATLATWSVARQVRDALVAAGFAVDKRPGFGGKREMLAARFAPRWRPRRAPAAAPRWPERHAIIVGAGLAGAAVASRLVMRRWRIDVIDGGAAPAGAASGLYAGVFQPHVSRDDSLLSRLTRAGFLYALREWPVTVDAAAPSPWRRCGVLQLADGAANAARLADTAAALDHPRAYAEYVTHDVARTLAEANVAIGGWWFPQAGCVRPAAIVRAQLDKAARHVEPEREFVVHLNRAVAALRRAGEQWQAQDAHGAVIAEAPVVVLANAHDGARLVDFGVDPLKRVRGQQTYLPVPPFAAPRVVVGGDGYVLPSIDGVALAGATYDLDNAQREPDAQGHATNLARAEHMLPGSTANVNVARLVGGVGFRCVATDRLPLVGAMVDIVAVQERAGALAGAHAWDLPRIHGLYGALAFASRGLVWTLLTAESLASQLEGEPLPLEGSLADAIDPGRFILHRVRRGML